MCEGWIVLHWQCRHGYTPYANVCLQHFSAVRVLTFNVKCNMTKHYKAPSKYVQTVSKRLFLSLFMRQFHPATTIQKSFQRWKPIRSNAEMKLKIYLWYHYILEFWLYTVFQTKNINLDFFALFCSRFGNCFYFSFGKDTISQHFFPYL